MARLTSNEPPGTAASTGTEEVVISRKDRQGCWDARDTYFACLDKNKIKSIQGVDVSMCSSYLTDMRQRCRETWVEYFIARRERTFEMEKYKLQVEEQVANDRKSRTTAPMRRFPTSAPRPESS
ncbi:uncharacterized protein V1518DRAFT_374827 [Limtongia smithiae]|uniref:uncharacterized protein n=1 Tax=Limtongia smithiae TaxID=1125753 RepID=UPI0034CECE27